MKTNKIDVCLSLALLNLFELKQSVIVVIDVLRATTAICKAFQNGVKEIIPVSDLDQAKVFKEKGYVVAAERNGEVLEFADFGNSPQNFTPERVAGKTIVYSTVNGVPALQKSSGAQKVIIASFLNADAVVRFLEDCKNDILLLCAGWKGNFNLEDTLLAGKIVSEIASNKTHTIDSDAGIASADLWNLYADRLVESASEFFQIKRLRMLGIQDELHDYFSLNISSCIPCFEKERIFDLRTEN